MRSMLPAPRPTIPQNLILTGSTTGLTVDKFNQLTAALDGLDGVTRGGAAEALTAMAASGNISADAIERLTASALKLERAGGPAVAETVKQFESLGKAPVDASLKINETTRYLTTAVYEQIKALEDRGKTSEAAAVAQKLGRCHRPAHAKNGGKPRSYRKGVEWGQRSGCRRYRCCQGLVACCHTQRKGGGAAYADRRDRKTAG